MANQNTIADLSTTPASNLNFKGQSIRGTAVANTIDTMFQNEASMLKAFYDSLGGVATVSGTDTYTVTITEDWAAYGSGLWLAIKPANANTGAATLNVTVPTAGALGAKAIRRQGDSALSANDMVANGVYLLRYSTSYNSSAGAWVLLNPASGLSTPVSVANGGTGSSSLTANYVILGNGTSAVQVVAPSTSGNALISNGTTWASSAPTTLGTPVASTSGTSIDFTGIPSGVKEVTVNFSGVSTSGTSSLLIQLGSGSVTSSGYVGSAARFGAAGVATATSSAGLFFNGNNASATITGTAIFRLIDATNYVWSGALAMGDTGVTFAYMGATAVTLSGALDRVRITAANGTDTFDAGKINISYRY